MKKTTKNIYDLLSKEDLPRSFKKMVDSNPNVSHYETNIQESYERFMMLRELLISSASNGALDEVSFSRRNSIFSIVNSSFQHRNNWQQLITQTENLYDHVAIADLFLAKMTSKDFASELKELTSLKRSVTDFKKNYSNTKKNLDFID